MTTLLPDVKQILFTLPASVNISEEQEKECSELLQQITTLIENGTASAALRELMQKCVDKGLNKVNLAVSTDVEDSVGQEIVRAWQAAGFSCAAPQEQSEKAAEAVKPAEPEKDSSDSDSSSDEEEEAKPEPETKKEDADSSDSDSSSDEDEAEPEKAPEKTKEEDSSSDDSSSDEEEEAAPEPAAKPAPVVTKKKPKNQPFRRVRGTSKSLESNAWDAAKHGGHGAEAFEKLGKHRGKEFIKAKNKRKRSNRSGFGAIDLGVRSTDLTKRRKLS